MPKLWNETIEAHRRDVRDAILETAASLVGEHGLRGVTMSQIAAQTGIGRATLYKYFPDVEAIVDAWHDRQIRRHLDYLTDVRDSAHDPLERLEAVLDAFAHITYESRRHHQTELASILHRGEHFTRARRQLREMVRELIAAGVAAGEIRDDIAPDELTQYCLHALSAAREVPSRAALRRLVAVTLSALGRDADRARSTARTR